MFVGNKKNMSSDMYIKYMKGWFRNVKKVQYHLNKITTNNYFL